MAKGLAGSWGTRTENDPSRQVQRAAMPQALAAKLHTQYSSADLYTIPEYQWQRLSGGLVDRADVENHLRVYESYQ